MSVSIRMYPMINKEMIERSGIITEPPELYYHNDDDSFMLELKNIEGTDNAFRATVSDPRIKWNPEDYEIHMKQGIIVDNVSAWYGPEGVAPADATLGMALHWSSIGSEQQGTCQMSEVVTDSGCLRAEGSLKFPRGFLKGSIFVDLIVYLKKPGRPEDNEKHLCNASGAVLGSVMQYQLYIDGSGSSFPIGKENCPGKPLWRIKYESDEIMTDLFDFEKVGIVLNTAHRDYHLINQDSSDYCQPFFSEVLADALVVMMEILKQSAKDQAVWDDILSGENYEPGTIADAMHFYVVNLEWNTEDLLSLCESVHTFIDKNLKGEVK